MYYHFKIHRDSDSLWAECVELEGCVTQGKNDEHLHEMMKEALNLYLDEPDLDVDLALPKPSVKGKDVVKVPVDPEVAFAFYVRHYRKKKKISQKEMMNLLEMKNIFSYQRLEKKHNPRLSTLAKVKKIFPEISIDAILDV